MTTYPGWLTAHPDLSALTEAEIAHEAALVMGWEQRRPFPDPGPAWTRWYTPSGFAISFWNPDTESDDAAPWSGPCRT